MKVEFLSTLQTVIVDRLDIFRLCSQYLSRVWVCLHLFGSEPIIWQDRYIGNTVHPRSECLKSLNQISR